MLALVLQPWQPISNHERLLTFRFAKVYENHDRKHH